MRINAEPSKAPSRQSQDCGDEWKGKEKPKQGGGKAQKEFVTMCEYVQEWWGVCSIFTA